MLTNRHLMDLAQRPGPWVTLSMPLTGGGPLAKGDPIRYRNLVRRAGGLLDARGAEQARRDAMVAKLTRLGRKRGIFNTGALGLVVFASADGIEHWHMPLPLEEMAHLDERPFLEPLIPLVTDTVHFYVIALSQRHVRLLECNRFVARELPLPDGTPTRLEDAAGWEVRQDSLQYHAPHSGPLLGGHSRKHGTPVSGAGNRPIYHGHGAGKDDTDADLEKFVRELDKGLWKAIVHRSSPVVVAASEQLEPVFRAHTRLPNLVESFVHGNFERTPDTELHAKAWTLLEPRFSELVERAKSRLCDLLGTGVATTEVAQVVTAAADGKIDTLFVREGAHVTGSFDAATHRVHLGDGRDSTTNLIDRATTDTFLSGGKVYRLDAAHMPVDAEAAAIFRY